MSSRNWDGGILGRPALARADDGVENGEQFPQAGHQREVLRLPRGEQALIERANECVPPRCHQGPHVEHRAHAGAAALDEPPPPHRAGVATQRRDADELGDLAAREPAQFGEIGEPGEREHGSDAGHTLPELIAFPPHGRMPDHVAQVGVGDPHLALEIARDT